MSRKGKSTKDGATAYLNKLIYAALGDLDAARGDSVVNEFVVQTFANLQRPEAEQREGLKNRFTISPDVKHVCDTLFNRFIEECHEVDVAPNMSATDLAQQLNNNVADCHSAAMVQLGLIADRFGPNLRGMKDPSNWFQEKIVGGMKDVTDDLTRIGSLVNSYNGYIKGLAWNIAVCICLNNTSVSLTLLQQILLQCGMRQDLVFGLVTCLPEKPAPKPRKSKKDGDATKPVFSDAVETIDPPPAAEISPELALAIDGI